MLLFPIFFLYDHSHPVHMKFMCFPTLCFLHASLSYFFVFFFHFYIQKILSCKLLPFHEVLSIASLLFPQQHAGNSPSKRYLYYHKKDFKTCLFSEVGINFTCLLKYLTIYEGERFIHGDTQKLFVSQNQFTEAIILFMEIG